MRPIYRGRTLAASLLRWTPIAIDETKLVFTVNSVDRTLYYERDSLDILDDLNELPNTLSFACFGFVPAKYQIVRVTVGTTKEFEGRIMDVAEYHDRLNNRTVYRVACVDYTWDFDALLVTKAYGSQSATTTAQDIVTNFTSGFTQVKIAASLPTVAAIQFKMTKPSSALRQLCDAIGGDCYVDYDKDAHVFLTETDITPDIISAATTNWRAFKYRSLINRVINRIFVEGMGSTSTSAVAAGATSIPLNDPSVFSSGGGSVVIGNQIVTYTGIGSGSTTAVGGSSTVAVSSSTVAARPRPTVTPTLSDAGNGTGGAVQELGNWTAKFTHIYSDGVETPPSAASNTVAGQDFHGFNMTQEVGPSGVTDHGVYFKLPSYSDYGSQFGARVTTGGNGNGPTLHGNNTYQSTPTPPTTDAGYTAGGTFLYVNDTSIFSASGGSVKVGTQTITYTGRSTSSGVGALTGIPASSTGSITAAIAIGATVTVVYAAGSTSLAVVDTAQFLSGGGSARIGGQTFTYTGRSTSSGAGNLTGIPASGAGSLSSAVSGGDTVTVVYPAGSTSLTVTDTTNFSGSGGTARAGTQTFTYTGRSTASGVGNLTGIPASGAGSLTSAVSGGDTVLVGAGGNGTLTGIPASGAGAIVNVINQGDQVNLLIQRDDATSQSTYGIRHGYVQDRRLSIAGAQARGDAELTLRKDPYVEGSFVTSDTKVRSGRRVTISLASEWNLFGTYTISRVRVFWDTTHKLPQREVTFSSNSGDNDLYRILRRIREQQQQQTAA